MNDLTSTTSVIMYKQYSLAALFRQYHVELRDFVSRTFGNPDNAEDIVQDAFQKMLSIHDINKVESPRAYLYQTARNLALNTIRSEGRSTKYLASLPEEEETTVPMFRQFSANKDLERLNISLKKLPQKYRQTFLLVRVEGKSYKEVSDELGIAVSTIEKHIVKVLQFLRKEFHERDSL